MSEVWAEQTAASRDLASGLTRFNPPGLDALSYRVATYQASLARMLARLPVVTVELGDGSIQAPLAGLNVEAEDDWAVALLHAWAVTADVLSFYQERITNEGYLRTATERRSVLELARSIGYELRPGVAAGTYLAFTVQVGHDEPPRRVEVPASSAVQGMSATSQLPQVFETSEACMARSAWNSLRLASEDWARTIWPGTTSVRLAGSRMDLQAGGKILIVGDDGAAVVPERRWLLATSSEVKADPQRGYTVISWKDEIGMPGASLPLHNARLFTLEQPGGLFGLFAYSQAAVDYRRADSDRWRPAGIGLPKADVHALVRNAEGHLYAGTAQDVFRSLDNGQSWQPAPTGSLRRNVTALAVDEGGALYAGTDQGGIYLSQDDGRNWAAMSGEAVVQPPKRLKKWLPFLFSRPLPKTTVRSLVISPQRRKRVLVAGTDDGVFRSTDQGKTWQAANFDLPGLDWKTGLSKTVVWSLAVAKRGWRRHLFAGTDAGVFRINALPRFWPLLIANLILLLVLRSLSEKESLVAHLLALAKQLPDKLTALVKAVPEAVAKVLSALVEALPEVVARVLGSLVETLPKDIADVLSGDLKSINCFIGRLPDTWPDLPGPWDVLNAPLTFLVDFLLVTAVVALVLAIVKGIDRFINSRPRRCIGIPVYALAVGENGQLFAGTARGVYRSYGPKPRQDGNWLQRLLSRLKIHLLQSLIRDWRRVTRGFPIQDVRAVAVTPEPAVLAGTGTGELFRSDDDGEAWVPFDDDLALAGVEAIAGVENGQLAAGTAVENETEKRWSSPQVEKAQIDLDQVYPDIAPQRWVVLQRADDRSEGMLYRVQAATTTNSQDFNQVGQFTRLVVDANTDLDQFDRQTTEVWVQDEALALHDDRPVTGGQFTLDRFVPGLESGHRLVFSGKRVQVRPWDPAGTGLTLRSADGLRSAPITAGESLQLMSPPRPADGADGGMVRWHLRNRRGFVGSVAAGADTLVLAPAAEDDEIVAEVAQVESVDHRQERTRIALRAPLDNVYDRSSLTIYGNVVHATHGRTVRDEVLGSGDGSQPNQRFRLRQGPLTFVSAPTASGVETTLAIQVSGVTWHQVPFFQGLDRGKRAYVVRQDARGNTSVVFGDGKRGARLPSNHEQITATYRIGIGPEGNVPAGSLNQLQTAPQGIERVINPLPATGGVGPEKTARARQNAPLTVRAMGRIVSLADYEDFVRVFAGIGKAQARLLHTGHRNVLHITIADGEGQPIPVTSDLYRKLVQAIDENRGTPQPQVRVDSYEPVYFNLRARLLIDPDHRERRAAIEADVRREIGQAFAFSEREFGQDVSDSELIRLMQDTAGVVAVELVDLYRSTEEAGSAPVLEANPARWHDGRPLPAQMLLVNEDGGIALDVEVAA